MFGEREMIEIVHAVRKTTSAFNAIKKGFEVGRDIESMSKDLVDGWVQYQISRRQTNTIKNHLCLKNYLTGSVEEEKDANIHGKKRK